MGDRPIWCFLFSNHNFLSVYYGSLECLLDDSLEVPGLFGAGQLGEQVCSSIALLRYVVYLKTFEVVNEIFGNVVVLEQRCFLGLVFVDNFPLHKLRGSVTL